MRRFLLFLVLAIFLYSPYGPSWGQTAVNFAIVAIIFGFVGRGQNRRRYY